MPWYQRLFLDTVAVGWRWKHIWHRSLLEAGKTRTRTNSKEYVAGTLLFFRMPIGLPSRCEPRSVCSTQLTVKRSFGGRLHKIRLNEFPKGATRLASLSCQPVPIYRKSYCLIKSSGPMILTVFVAGTLVHSELCLEWAINPLKIKQWYISEIF